MSSTVSSTEVLQEQRLVEKKEEKRLVRTSSLEKIRRFNSFICTQNYYFLPAILTWLKSSQSGLQTATEKTIFVFRALLFTNFLYKLYQIEYKKFIKDGLSFLYTKIMVYWKLYLTLAVYLTMLILVVELGLCFYFMLARYTPYGLIFLVLCFSFIIYINYVTHRTQLNRLLIFTKRD